MLNQRKSWTSQEDQLLIKLYQQFKESIQNQNINWNFLAFKFNSFIINSQRSGKQCRERQNSIFMCFRWFNQLNPEINKNSIWSQQEKEKLIELHNKYGNKWALISKNLNGRTDNCIKNFMNSTLRKSLRLINLFVSKNRKFKQFKFRNLKEYKVDLLHKILYFSGKRSQNNNFQENFLLSTILKQNKQQILQEVYRLSKDIKRCLIFLENKLITGNINSNSENFFSQGGDFQNIINKIHRLNTICKKKKQKTIQNKRKQLKKTQKLLYHSDFSIYNLDSGIVGQQQQESENLLQKPETVLTNPSIQVQMSYLNQIHSDLIETTVKIEETNLDKKLFASNENDEKLIKSQNLNQKLYCDQKSERQIEQHLYVQVKYQDQQKEKNQSEKTQSLLITKKDIQIFLTNQNAGCNLSQNMKNENDKYQGLERSITMTCLHLKQKINNLQNKFNIQLNQESQFDDDENYYSFIDEIQDEKYLPLYPVYSAIYVEYDHNKKTSKVNSNNDFEQSQQEVI